MFSFESDVEAMVRLGLAALAAYTIALSHGGLRTHRRHQYRIHILVGLSACLMILSAGDSPDARSRAIQGVAIGVGFLGSGHILQAPSSQTEHSGVSIHGLTSAATVWFTATVGISIATSNLITVATAMLLALICLFLGNRFYRDNSNH